MRFAKTSRSAKQNETLHHQMGFDEGGYMVNPEEFKVELIKVPSPSGQLVGTVIHPVKVIHIPTGIYAVCNYERSQHANRLIAMRMVEYGLAELRWETVNHPKEYGV